MMELLSCKEEHKSLAAQARAEAAALISAQGELKKAGDVLQMEKRRLEGEISQGLTTREAVQKQLQEEEEAKAALERALMDTRARLKQASAAEQERAGQLAVTQGELDTVTRRTREQELVVERLEEELRALKRQVVACQGEVDDASRDCNKLELNIKMRDQELDAAARRHSADLENEAARYEALRANLGGVELEREELHQALTRLRSQLAAQQAELESAATAQATLSTELDRVTVDRDKKSITIGSLEQDRDKFKREVTIVGGELEDAIAERDKRGTQVTHLQDELQALKYRMAAELDNERARTSSAEARASKSEEERCDVEAKLLEMRRLMSSAQEEAAACKSLSEKLQSDVDRATQSKALLEQKLQQLEAELEALRQRMASELAQEQARFEALSARHTRTEDELAERERTIAELKAQLGRLEADLLAEQAKVRNLRSELDIQSAENSKNSGSHRSLEQELSLLQQQLASTKDELATIIADRTELKQQMECMKGEHKALIVRFEQRRIRSAVFLAALVLEKSVAMHFACSFYLWAQVASEGAMARGAEELSTIVHHATQNHAKEEEPYHMFDYEMEAIDVAAAAREFGL